MELLATVGDFIVEAVDSLLESFVETLKAVVEFGKQVITSIMECPQKLLDEAKSIAVSVVEAVEEVLEDISDIIIDEIIQPLPADGEIIVEPAPEENPEEGNETKEKGHITVIRKWQSNDATISTFYTHDNSVTGEILEPDGPSSTEFGSDKRIPPGTYSLVAHEEGELGGKGLYALVGVEGRAGIVIHYANVKTASADHYSATGGYTEGCLIPGYFSSEDKTTIYDTLTKCNELNKYIKTYIDQDGVDITIYELDERKNVYFAIYYYNPEKDKDFAFMRAAETWKQEIMSTSTFNSEIDYFLPFRVTSESEFKAAWQAVFDLGNEPDKKVVQGNIFSHSSDEFIFGINDPDTRGLEFVSDSSNDGTVSQIDIESLPVLNWDSSGVLTLSGCNTGHLTDGWAPGLSFSKAQKVKTIGCSGYSYFSQDKWNYVEINSQAQQIYLASYLRRANFVRSPGLGYNTRMDDVVFTP